jgi:RNA polymerase sigma factor (sigma-70 family)
LIVKNKELADDIFQDTFIKVINTIRSGTYNEEGKFLQWVMRIAHNLIIDHFRKSKRIPVIENSQNDDYNIFDTLDVKDASVEDRMITEQIHKDVKKLIEIIEDFKKGNFRVKMRNVFEVFEKGLLTQKDEQRLVETLRRMDEDNPTSIEDNLGRIRRVLEAVYIELAKQKPELIPADRIKYEKEQLLMSAIFNHLKESGGQPDFVNSLSWDIWKICSKYGAHSQAEKGDHAPSKHTVQSLAHALCEVLLWFKSA